jgi:hypothetical protein
MDVVRLKKCGGRVIRYGGTISYHIGTTLERHYYHPPHAQSAMCDVRCPMCDVRCAMSDVRCPRGRYDGWASRD